MDATWDISIAIDISSDGATTPLTGIEALAMFQDNIKTILLSVIPSIYQTYNKII